MDTVIYFSPIDECCHFAYIEHILTRHRLPTVRDYMSNAIFSMEEHIYPRPSTRDPSKRGLAGYIYEAMHPPLYYLAASAACAVVPGNLVQKLYFLRALGLLSLLGTVFVLSKSYRALVSRRLVADDPFLFFSILCVFTLTPGILLRMITISNLHLVLLLCGLFYHQILRLEGSSDLTLRRASILGGLTGCIIITHFLNVTLVGVGIAFLLLRRAHRLVPAYLACTTALVLPWFVFNYWHYGRFTGWTAIAPLLLNAVNPTRIQYDFSRILQQIDPRFFHAFWNPEETIQTLFLSDTCDKYLSGLISVAIFGCFAHRITRLFSPRRESPSGGGDGLFDQSVQLPGGIRVDSLARLDLLCFLGIALNFSMLVYMSWTESEPCLLGRYMYLSLWPLAFLTYRFLGAMPIFERRLFAFSLIASTVMVWTSFFVQALRNLWVPLPT